MGLIGSISRCAAGAMALAFVTLVASPASAQQEGLKVRAQKLFQQGLAASDVGDCARAIPLFRRSQATFAARGTLLNLADCEAKLGQVASAWKHLKELIAQLAPGDPRLAVAQEKMTALEPRVPRLVIEAPSSGPSPTAILMDGDPLPNGSIGAELPVDPGDHVLTVTWPGSKTEETRVLLAEGARQVVRLVPPASQPLAAPVAKPTTPPPLVADSQPSPSYRRPLGFVVGGIGIAAIGVGAVTGILAIGTKSDLEAECPDPLSCKTVEGRDLASKGETLTTTSTVTFVLGLAGLGGGIVLVLTSPDSPTSTALAPAALPGGGGAILRGRF
jgi:hypothetical protein